LREVIINVAQNAIDAMADVVDRRRQVRIETTRNGRRGVTISVEDTGPGIDPKNHNKVFDAFVTTKPKGTGLGLAISQMIVDRHGGQIVVMPGSEYGARFQITLPVQMAGVSSQTPE
jgi:signal transduction histidine kinase